MENQSIHVFTFQTNQVRTIIIDNEPWFVAKDVCDALGIKKHIDALYRLNSNEKDRLGLTDSIGRTQRAPIINESGLYKLILRSNKPEAKAFQTWVTSERKSLNNFVLKSQNNKIHS